MSGFEVKLPVRDPDELLTTKSIGELTSYIEDLEDRLVTRQLLTELELAKPEGMPITIGLVAESLAAMDKSVLRRGLDKIRKAAGLDGVDHLLHQRFQRTYVPKHRDAETVVLPSGALAFSTDIEDEASRQAARERSIAAQRASEAADRAVEAEAHRQYEQARDEQLRRETPRGVPIP